MTGETVIHRDPRYFVLEALPDDIVQFMKERADWMTTAAPRDSAGLEFLVRDVSRWNPGQRVRVAFMGGNERLHREIERATQEITQSCNLFLDFVDASGNIRKWSTADTAYAAEIRVAFDMGGYFSLVGTDSINPAVGSNGGAVGGNPGQRSLNLGGFHVNRPQDWEGTVRHEFLHALAFHHEHQNLNGPCQQEFRWEDDAGYERTRDASNQFVPDAQGRRPGIYTYLSGPPNNWNKAKVDHNLRTVQDETGLTAGTFDRLSVMLYRFPSLFYRTESSACAPLGEGLTLSSGDRQGLLHLYPRDPGPRAAITRRREEFVQSLSGGAPSAAAGLETISTRASQIAGGTLAALKGVGR